MLFGHQDDANRSTAPTDTANINTSQASASIGLNPLAVDPATGIGLPVTPSGVVLPVDASQAEPSILDQASPTDLTASPAFTNDPSPSTPFGVSQSDAQSLDDNSSPDSSSYSEMPSPAAQTTPSLSQTGQTPDNVPNPIDQPSATDDLLTIKQQALSQLGPLVSQLEQTPEEKFRTSMMLIQSTDNPALLKDAYDAAQVITDEKVRAQALLDIVNEINYFTQQQVASVQS
jgi:hypothetical protein